jgi:hypothetical protein
MEVFLGGTVNGSTWREELIPMLECDYFNPVVKDWNEEAQKLEIHKRQTCDFVLYVITPKMTGVYSIAEVVEDSNKRPQQTLFCIIENDDNNEFTEHQLKSLMMVKNLVRNNNARVFDTLEDVANFLNYIRGYVDPYENL